MDLDYLVIRAKNGSITVPEQNAVAALLDCAPPEANRYRMLYILGRSFAFQHEDFFARFLEHREEPQLAKLALEILCQQWGKSEKYLKYIEHYILGDPWDEYEDVRFIAISSAGSYLRDNKDNTFAISLLEILTSPNEEKLTREVAYSALEKAYGMDMQDISTFKTDFDLDHDMDPELLEWAEALAAKQASN